ncbi:tripartite tricarboxylate transporter permease [Succinatimonas hippei]|uniref:tripartite tricarboxylate transporter permease n=1 Tax=Succinatimonas hippei TaxID=626938 RepID=UPI0026EE090A|nr:tripartite tricarboxylate transporter permease [Succinatimonas hippei]
MDAVLEAVAILATFENVGLLLAGTAVGIFIGAMPGLSVNMGLALLFPITFSVGGMSGIVMLLGIYCGAIYGGSITAILLRTPGTPASAATTLDGYPMAITNGQPGRALSISTMASTFGGVFSTICLILFAPVLAKVALQFSKPEYFALAIFGISMITSVSSGSILKGLISCLIGLFIATIGLDAMSGLERFTLGTLYLSGGVSFMPILIGLFALTQVFVNVEDAYKNKQIKQTIKIDNVLPTWADFKLTLTTLLRSSCIGTFIGCVPGTGGDISSWISYDQAKRWAKDKSQFGKGDPRGIAASESGNNSIVGGAFIPVLTLGIPGDGATAIILGALMVHGMQPGPLLFVDHAPDVYAIFIGMMAANIVMGMMGFSLIRLFVKVVNIPRVILLPIITIMAVIGTYSYNNSMNDVLIMFAAGIVGYFMNKIGMGVPGVIIGIILGSLAEQNFTGSLMMSDGSLAIFATNPICAVFLVLSVISLLSPLYKGILGKMLKN